MWDGTPEIAYGYQWQRCAPGCVNIAGATDSTYMLTVADENARDQTQEQVQELTKKYEGKVNDMAAAKNE